MWRATTIWLDEAHTRSETHVYPLVDVRDHEESPRCWCCPRSEPTETGLMWVHYAQVPQRPATARRTA